MLEKGKIGNSSFSRDFSIIKCEFFLGLNQMWDMRWPKVGSLDSGSRGLGSSPGRVIVLCSCAKHFTFTVPLSTTGKLGSRSAPAVRPPGLSTNFTFLSRMQWISGSSLQKRWLPNNTLKHKLILDFIFKQNYHQKVGSPPNGSTLSSFFSEHTCVIH